MSRTKRRLHEKHEAELYAQMMFDPERDSEWWIERVRKQFNGLTDQEIKKRYKARFYSDAHTTMFSVPKYFRQFYNRRFRRKNNRLLYIAVKKDMDFIEIPFKRTIHYDYW